MYTYTDGHSKQEPEGGWLKFYQELSPERKAAVSAFREAHYDEITAIAARRRELEAELSELDGRQHWLEGLEEVALGRATIRSRSVGLGSSLIVYEYRKDSPTGVLSLPGAAPDDTEHRVEAASVGTVYAGAY